MLNNYSMDIVHKLKYVDVMVDLNLVTARGRHNWLSNTMELGNINVFA